MLGLTSLGIFHTAIGLIAIAAGAVALIRDKAIDPARRVGQVYLSTTLITVLTGFGIFQHGGFGKPHALGVLTLLVLALADHPEAPIILRTVGAIFVLFLIGASLQIRRLRAGATRSGTRDSMAQAPR